jgi:radical SAM protein (TIGR04043 family)
MTEVRDAGADSIGIHLEAFDQGVRERIMPGKARIGVDYYFAAFRKAVELFGVGQVSSYVIVGLGESPQSIIAGCQRLVDVGVYPVVVPLRPILGTAMQDAAPPSPETMALIYRAVAGMLEQRGMSHADSKAGCARCGACSGLPTFMRRPPKDLGGRQPDVLR